METVKTFKKNNDRKYIYGIKWEDWFTLRTYIRLLKSCKI